MSKKIYKILCLLLCLCLVFEQGGFAQSIGQIDISGYLTSPRNNVAQDKFRPLHLRYLAYDTLNNNFNLLVDKGSNLAIEKAKLEDSAKPLMDYFFVGLSLPNDAFWVNLRPDAEINIIDDELAKTDIGKIMLEADVQLKKDTARYTSPTTPEGKEYWDKLYKKAGEIFGYDNIEIPTLTRPWIVPDEILVGETKDGAYIFKATLKVLLEQDYLKDSAVYNFSDERLKTLNEYSSRLIRELIIPTITQEVNTSKRYASLRQVYYSLILAQWFKQRFQGRGGYYSQLIDRKNLTGLASKTTWSKTTYFKEYQESFKNGEYSLNESVYTPFGQTIRSYFSGGIKLAAASPANNAFPADTIPFDNKNLSSMEYNGNMGAIRTGIAIASLSSATTFGSSPLTDDLKEKLSAIYNSRSTFLIQEGKVIPDTISERFRPKFPKVYSLITNAKITDNDIVLDPFAGTGGVGLLIATICNPKKLILTDISYGMPANGIEFAIQNNIEAWTESIRGIMPSSLKKEGKSIDLEYRRDDALKLSSFNDGSVTKIISDPPRGEGINARMNINKQDAYNLFVDSLNSAARVLREGGEAFYIIPQEWCRYLNKDERVNKPYFKMDIISEFFEGERTTLIKFKKSSSPTQSSSPIVEKSESTNLVGGDKPGGIDFRSLPIVNQAISNLKAFNGDILSLNLNSEWQDIERLIQSGITPSGERIKEYLQVSCHQEKIMRDKEKMIICISNILRQQEERYIPTEPVLRDILIVLESTRSEGELRTIFLGTKP